jgi:hypothetical protein
MNRKVWMLVVLFILIIPLIIVLILDLVPDPYEKSLIFAFILIFIPYLIYKRRRYSKGDILFQLAQNWPWRVYGTIVSIIFSLGALFFIIVGIKFIYRGFVPSLYEGLMILAPIVLFGSVPFLTTTKITLLNNVLVTPGWTISWRKIRGWKWLEDGDKKAHALVIYFNLFGIRIPFTIRGFVFDIKARQEIDRIFEEKISKKLPLK